MSAGDVTSTQPGKGLAPALAACAQANAHAHFAKWDVQLPEAASPDLVRVDWPAPGDTAGPLPTASILKGEKWVRVHSARRPLDEARLWVEQALGERVPDAVCVIGAGLGYVIDVLLDRRPETRVLVLEPEPALVPWLIARRDWRDEIAAGRLLIVPGPTFQQCDSAWRLLTPPPESMPVLASPVICAARHTAALAARETATVVLENALANDSARKRFAGTILLNTLRNLPVLASEAPVSALQRLFADRVAVVAGAGPSLNHNIEQMRPYRDRAVLIAVGTALKPLAAAGMAPDIVVAVDPGDYTPRQFAGVADLPRTFLVAEAGVAPPVFERFLGRTFLFRVGRNEPWAWLIDHGVDPGLLRSWASVIISALHLGIELGCDTLVFIGADLAYTNGQTHALGTLAHEWMQWFVSTGVSEQDAWNPYKSPAECLETGVDGQACSTTPTLTQFRDWIRHESLVTPQVTFINATGAGILHGGRIQQSSVKEVAGALSRLPGASRVIRRAHDQAMGRSQHHLLSAWREMSATHAFPSPWVAVSGVDEIQAALPDAPATQAQDD